MTPKIASKTSKTVVVSTTTTKYKFENSPVVVIETKCDDNPSIFTFDQTGPHDSIPVVIKDCDFSKLHFSELWDKAKYSFKSLKEIDFDNIYYLYTVGHVLFDINGDPVPYLHRCDYISTPFHNECLYLKKAIEVLKKHPWVMNKEDLKIENIPGYNCDEKRNKYISVHLYPDKETYKKLYQESLIKCKNYWSCRLKEMIHDGHRPDKDHNLLGLLECVRPEKDEDDE